MNDNEEMLREVAGGKEESGDVKCPYCGSANVTETGSYLSSRDQCLVSEYKCGQCGQTFEINH
ncbi:MAG: hypothetical protein K6A70_07495 [Erysipelotrichaceae bacterium]|jgi:transposase-like protein|nr:hypothetical protein [Erysipelotrichaceae bacterium]